MNAPFVLIIAAIVYFLIFTALYLTYREFHDGSPKQQEDGKEELAESPHSHVYD
ncbi:MAG: hypothetical protein JKX81_17965 [Arenicella sp.]|nr:hypothetical protein [Arenicella sp.]